MTSNGITFKQIFVKVGEMVQRHTGSVMISEVYFVSLRMESRLKINTQSIIFLSETYNVC